MSEGTWYRTGLVSLANGSDLIAGVGTEFIANVLPGAIFFAPEGLYEVERAVSDTQLKLVEPYAGPSVAGAEFAIAPTQGAVVQATKQLQAFLSELGELKQAWESGDLDPKGLATKGVKNTVEELPAVGNTPGDAWLVDGVLYMWTGAAWSNQGSTVTTPELEELRADTVAAKDATQAIATAFGDVAMAVAITEDKADAASASAAVADAAKTLAESARDAALIGASVYPDEATGRAAVADGVAFKVQGSGNVAAIAYRRVSAASSVEIARYPSVAGVEQLPKDLSAGGLAVFTGTGTVLPIVTDLNGNVLLGWDTTAQALTGQGILSEGIAATLARAEFGKLGPVRYIGTGTIIPVITDQSLNVLLGYDTVAGAFVGEIVGATGPVRSAMVPLPSALRPVGKAINHMLAYGQSLSVGAKGTPVISTTQPYSNITFNGGPRGGGDFSAFKPLVEDTLVAPDGGADRGETPCSGAANTAMTLAAKDGVLPSSHVILASTAGKGGTAIAGLKKGSAWYASNFIAHVSGAKALNADYAVHAVPWYQGEQDAVSGVHTPYATYRADLLQLQADAEADIKAITGQASPVFFLPYQLSNAAMTWPDMALAQLDLAQKSDRFFLTTPCYHLPYAADRVHLQAVGYKWLGAYAGRAYKHLVIDGVRPRWLNPLSATLRGTTLRARFDVPVLPLVLDTSQLAPTTANGFRVVDSGGTVAISSMRVDGSDVVIELGAVPAGATVLRYALDYLGTGLTVLDGASGNLRDSDPDTTLIAGTAYPLFHIAPHFSLPVVRLGD